MKLWLIEQDVNTGYDTYDSAVVAAETEEEARTIHPSEGTVWHDGGWCYVMRDGRLHPATLYGTWANPPDVRARQLGSANPGTERGVILASFNAG